MAELIPDIILPKPKVLITLYSGNILEYPLESDGKALNVGYIRKIFETSSNYSEGDYVLFSIEAAIQKIGYSGVVFYLVNEEDIFFKVIPYSAP